MNRKAFALIITFNPDIERLFSHTEKLLEMGFEILIVDNKSVNNESLKKQYNYNQIMYLEKNVGIAKALNIGMEEIKKRNGYWVMSLDQDTEFDDNILSVYQKYLNLPYLGALCPRVNRIGIQDTNQSENNYFEVDKCPTAGFFTNIDVWELVGRYDDWMFIDYVDYDFCMRIRLNNLKIYRVSEALITQRLGNLYVHPVIFKIGKIFSSKLLMNFAHTYNHNSFRNYYFVRNALYYRHKYKSQIDSTQELIHLVKWELKKMLLENNRIETFESLIRGIRDYRKRIQTTDRY